jgi:hypothetical protein
LFIVPVVDLSSMYLDDSPEIVEAFLKSRFVVKR